MQFKKIVPIGIGAVVVIVFVVGLATNRKGQVTPERERLNTPLEEVAKNISYQDIKMEWKRFDSPELGLSIQYPGIFVDNQFGIDSGDTGKIVHGFLSTSKCMDPPCSRVGITFGGVTSDYSAPKEGSGVEKLGFVKRDGKYFLKMLGNQEAEIDYPVREIKAANITGIIISGDNRPPAPEVLGSSDRMAIFNLKSSAFKAITLIVNVNDIPEQAFETILQTIEIR
jgi:hypothetical protein